MVCVIEDRGCQGWTNDEVHLKLLEAFCREHAVRLIKVTVLSCLCLLVTIPLFEIAPALVNSTRKLSVSGISMFKQLQIKAELIYII